MRTVLLDLPCDCRGYVVDDGETGDPCIVLNARMNHETNVKSYEHELRHIKNDDLHCCESTDEIELYCHKNDNKEC